MRRASAVARRVARPPYRAGRRAARYALAPLNPHNPFRPRRFDICCCGLSKSGTHSFAGIFEGYRSVHHPDAAVRLPLAMEAARGRLDVDAARRTLRRRDRLLWLEAESSTLAGMLIEPLADACPGKRFVLTIRDVFSWCDSWIDHNLNQPAEPGSPWLALDRLRLGADDAEPTVHDAPLTERGFPPLPCFFRLWATHNTRVLAALPDERLLVLRTGELSAQLPALATFAGVPPETLRADRAWLFATTQHNRTLSLLDPGYVRDTADRLCEPLMTRFFPEVSWPPRATA